MEAVLQSLWSGLPVLALHLVTTLILLAAGVWCYEKITPYKELDLIREGNFSASVTFGAAILGIAIPLSAAMKSSISLLDLVFWGVVTVLLQMAAYLAADLLMKDIRGRIESNELAAATVMASVKLAVGLILAAAVSG